jgi:hypothetical protein
MNSVIQAACIQAAAVLVAARNAASDPDGRDQVVAEAERAVDGLLNSE